MLTPTTKSCTECNAHQPLRLVLLIVLIPLIMAGSGSTPSISSIRGSAHPVSGGTVITFFALGLPKNPSCSDLQRISFNSKTGTEWTSCSMGTSSGSTDLFMFPLPAMTSNVARSYNLVHSDGGSNVYGTYSMSYDPPRISSSRAPLFAVPVTGGHSVTIFGSNFFSGDSFSYVVQPTSLSLKAATMAPTAFSQTSWRSFSAVRCRIRPGMITASISIIVTGVSRTNSTFVSGAWSYAAVLISGLSSAFSRIGIPCSGSVSVSVWGTNFGLHSWSPSIIIGKRNAPLQRSACMASRWSSTSSVTGLLPSGRNPVFALVLSVGLGTDMNSFASFARTTAVNSTTTYDSRSQHTLSILGSNMGTTSGTQQRDLSCDNVTLEAGRMTKLCDSDDLLQGFGPLQDAVFSFDFLLGTRFDDVAVYVQSPSGQNFTLFEKRCFGCISGIRLNLRFSFATASSWPELPISGCVSGDWDQTNYKVQSAISASFESESNGRWVVWAVSASQPLLVRRFKMVFVSSSLLFFIGGTSVSSISWTSDSCVVVGSAPGVGRNLTVSGTSSELPVTFLTRLSFSYPAPISSNATFNQSFTGFATINSGNVLVSMIGSYFSSLAASQTLRMALSTCSSSAWKSDTLVLCRSPAITSSLSPSLFVVTVNMLTSNLSNSISFLPPLVTRMQASMQHHSTGSRSITILGEFGLALYSRAISVNLRGTSSPRTLWQSHSHIQARSVQSGFTPNTVQLTASRLISTQIISLLNFTDLFPSSSVILNSDSTLAITGSSSILLFGSSFAVQHLTPEIRVELTACPFTNWISDSVLEGKSMSQALGFDKRSIYVSLTNRPFVVSSGFLFTYLGPTIFSMNQSNTTHSWTIQNGTLLAATSTLNVSLSCGTTFNCSSSMSILSLSAMHLSSINPIGGLNVSIRLTDSRPLLPCDENIWVSDSSLHCRVDTLPQDWSLIAFPTFLFQASSSSSTFTSQVKNILFEQPDSPISNSLAIVVTTNSSIRSQEILDISILVENNSSFPYSNANGYIGINVSMSSISTAGLASITSGIPETSIYLAQNTLKSTAELSIVMVSPDANTVPLSFTFLWYSTISPSVQTVLSVKKLVSIVPNGILNFSFIQDVPDRTSVTVNYGWLSQSPTPQVKFTFSTPCELYSPRLLVSVFLVCVGLPDQKFLDELTSSSCVQGSLVLAVKRNWFAPPLIPTTCHFMFSLHSSVALDSLSSRLFSIVVGPPVAVFLLGTLPSFALRSDDALFTANTTAGPCIVAYFKDLSGFRVPYSGISASLSAMQSFTSHYDLGLSGNGSFVSQTDIDGNVSWCGVYVKLITPTAFLQISWASNDQSFSDSPMNSTFSVNGSGVRATATFKSTPNNISVTPGLGVPSVNLTLSDAAGNVYEPLPYTYIRITVTPSGSLRRRLLTSAESAATCASGGPKFVLVTSSDVTVQSSLVFACTAGTSVVQYDVGLLANGIITNNILLNGSFNVVSPAVASFSILVSSGPAVSFRFIDLSSTSLITFTVIQSALAVMCHDIGRNIVDCNFTFTVNASSIMPVSFQPASFSLSCNQTLVISSQCFIPSFSVALNSTAFFSNISVRLNVASSTLLFDSSMFALNFAPLCAPGTYIIRNSSDVNGICANCSSNGFSNISDALACSFCPAGSAPSNRTGCRDCPENTYANQSGSSQCISCPANYFSTYSHTECLTFEFVDIPPTLIASDSDTPLPCVRLTSNVGGIVNASVAQGIVIRIFIIPEAVDGVTVMANSVVKITLQNSNVSCQTATVKVNRNVVESLFLPKYAWALQFDQCNIAFCIFSPYILSASAVDQRVVLPYNVSILPPPPQIDRASTAFFDFIGGTVVTVFGQHFKVFPGSATVGSSQCIFKMVGGARNITVPAQLSDPVFGKQLLCGGTAVDDSTVESGGLFGAPFQSWNVNVILSDGRLSVPNTLVNIQTQCKNSTRFLNNSRTHCSRCPENSFSTMPDASFCLCAKGSFGKHPVCRRCPLIPGFDCTRDNMTEVAILPGYYINLEKLSLCTINKCPALEKCSVEEACPGIPGKCLNTEERCYTPDQPGCGSCCRKFYKDQDGKCLACPQGNYTLIFIIIILLLVVCISVMQSFESPALVSSFKGLLTVMSFVQSFVSLRFLDIDWPPIMKELFNVFRPFTFSLDFVRPECSVDLTPEQKLYGVLFVPISCCVGVAVAKVLSVSFWLYRLHLKIAKTSPTGEHSLNFFGYRELMRCLIISSFGLKLRREIISEFGAFYYALNPLLFTNANWNVGTISDRARRGAHVIGNSKHFDHLNKSDPKVLAKSASAFPPVWTELRRILADAEIDTTFMRYALEIKKSASGALSVLILSFVGVLETALPIMNCFDQVMEDGTIKRFMRSDRSVECSLSGNSLYRSLAAMAIIGLFVYAVCMPLAMHIIFRSEWCLRFYRLDYASHNHVFGFVTSRYKRDYLHWELLNHFRKGSQIAIPLYYASQPVQQSVLLFFLNCVFSIMVLYTMPFSSKFLNVMEIMSSLDLVVTVIVGIFFTVEHKGVPVMSEDTKKFAGFALVFLCAATLAASFSCIFNELVFLTKFHKKPAVSAWLKFFSGNAGDSIEEKSLFNLFCTALYNKSSSKAIVDFNSSVQNLKNHVSCFWLRSWYALMSYYPASRLTLPFLRHPVLEMLKDLHHITRRIQELRRVGIYAPESQLPPCMTETHGDGDPPHQVYQKIAEIDDLFRTTLSGESNRYMLAILVADKFRNKGQEDIFTKRYWDRILPASNALVDAIAKVNSTSGALCALKPAQKAFWGRLSDRLWTDHSQLHSMISVIESFNQMSCDEHARFLRTAHGSNAEASSDACSIRECHDNNRIDGCIGGGGSLQGMGRDRRPDDDDAGARDDLDDENCDDSSLGDSNEDDAIGCDIPYNSDDFGSSESEFMEAISTRKHIERSSDQTSDRTAQGRSAMKLELHHQQNDHVHPAPSHSTVHLRSRASISDFHVGIISKASHTLISKDSGRTAQRNQPAPVAQNSTPFSAQSSLAPAPVAQMNSALSIETKSAANILAPAPPPVRHKGIAEVSPRQSSGSSFTETAIMGSAAANVLPSDGHLDRPLHRAISRYLPEAKSAAEAPAPASAASLTSGSLQPTNALNQAAQQSSAHRPARNTVKSAASRPRHVALASATELQGAVAVDIPVGDDHKKAKFVFDWPVAAPPPTIPSKSASADKVLEFDGPSLEAAASAHRNLLLLRE